MRIAFASVFLINAALVWADPFTPADLFQKSILSHWLTNPEQWVRFINLNDLLMGLVILVNRSSSFLWMGVGFWLLATTAVRLASLIPGGDPTELLNSILDMINQLPQQ